MVNRRKKNRLVQNFIYALAGLIVIVSIQSTIIVDTDWDRIGSLAQIFKSVRRFVGIDTNLITQLFIPTVETFMMACLGTLLGVIVALPVIWFSAKNITPFFPITFVIGRAVMTLSRSVHEIVWALLFVSTVGLGAFPGILALSMRSIGFMSKITAEAVEDIDIGPIEAIRAVGGNRFQVILFGIIPQVLPVYIGNIIFQWDINIRRSAIMGLVGAGGLGLTLHRQLVMYNYAGVTTVVIAVLVLVGIGEVVSYYARKAII